MKRLIAGLIVAGAIALGVASHHGTDPSPNPLKPCAAGYTRSIVPGSRAPYEYACYPAVSHAATTHRKKRQ